MPGFTFGGPILKNRLFGFVGFNPEFYDVERKVNYDQAGGLGGLGVVAFSQNTQTYYTTARLDAVVSQKIRLYASWLYQLQKQSGENLPFADSTAGLFNVSSSTPPIRFRARRGIYGSQLHDQRGRGFFDYAAACCDD